MPIYVQHEVLGRIPDVFNAEAIWRAPGLALFSRRPLLRDLLERSPREQRGRAATRCFSHVTLTLPQEEVDDDYHLSRGARARDLAQTLTALHQKDFGDLLGADQVRYDIVGADALAPGQIEVRFGHAVYLPGADEKVLYNVSLSRDGAAWKPVCPIYPNQRLALIGGDEASAHVAAAGWPFGGDGAILLINDGPDAPVDVQVRPRDAFECRYDPRSGCYTITSRRGINERGAGTKLFMKIEQVGGPVVAIAAHRAGAPGAAGGAGMANDPIEAPGIRLRDPAAPSAAPTQAAVWQPRPARSAGAQPTPPDLAAAGAPAAVVPVPLSVWRQPHDADRTALPQNRPSRTDSADSFDATFAPITQQRVCLVALALPRLSRYRNVEGLNAASLEIAFDHALAVRAGADAISFSVTAADELYASTGAGRQRIAAPASFAPVDDRAIRIDPVDERMAERYCALLSLPQPQDVAVAAGARFVFGRNVPVLAALRLLDSPRFLRQPSGEIGGASADRIGLSRNAFSFEAAPQGFTIGRLAATQALYHLDDKLRFVAKVESDEPYRLPGGHHLVAGHYVLRFDAA